MPSKAKRNAAKPPSRVVKGKPAATKPTLLAGGNPQIEKADGDARAGLHRGHAGLETRRRAPPRRAHRAQRTQGPQGRALELALLWRRGSGLVPQLPLLHEVRQGRLLPRHVAASCPTRRVQAQGRALPRYPRGRPARRGADGDVDQAGGRPARLDSVAWAGIVLPCPSMAEEIASWHPFDTS